MSTRPRFKYLEYIIRPTHIPSTDYDLVGDDEFVTRDERIPVLVLIKYGIFPSKESFRQSKYDFTKLEGLQGQTVAFIYKYYCSLNEDLEIRLFNVPIDNFSITRETFDKRWWYSLPVLDNFSSTP